MKKGKLFLACDIGTSVMKAGIFSSEGRMVQSLSTPYRFHSPRPGRAEMDPRDWWRAFVQTINKFDKEKIARVASICIGGQHPTLVSVNRKGNPTGQALIWADRRSTREAEFLTDRLGRPFDPSQLVPKALWIKRNQKVRYKQTKWFMQAFDYLSYKLTGKPCLTDLSTDYTSWPPEAIEAAEISPEKLPPRKVTGDFLGKVKNEASKETKITPGTPVICGPIDAYASFLGTATVEKGWLCEVGGTSDVLGLCQDEPLKGKNEGVWCTPHIVKNKWIVGAMVSTTGKALEWLKDRLEPNKEFSTFIEEALNVDPCPAIFLPYLSGERSPIWNPRARGVFFGLSLNHGNPHLARAVIESTCFSLKHNLEQLTRHGVSVEKIVCCGGQAKSDGWSQLKADILGETLKVPEILHAELLGESIIAGWGAEILSDPATASKKFTRIRATFRPRKSFSEKYNRTFKLYKKIYQDLRKDFEELAEVVNK